jgi:phenylacetic acid degradation operon negative regulatory protein
MAQPRKVEDDPGPQPGAVGSARPLSARSVVASTLLGIDPPRLPTRVLVRSGELFGITEGTTRVALSRMVAAGELVVDGHAHVLAGRLLDRQARQRASRAPVPRRWSGDWMMAVVVEPRRSVSARTELRRAMETLRLAERREGVWLRPDNLDSGWADAADAVVDAQCQRFVSRLGRTTDDAGALAADLWDLAGWAGRAEELRGELAQVVVALETGDTDALAPGFVLSAAVLRHLVSDPLLPPELLAAGWPRWPGDSLRTDYDRYDRAFKSLWRDWFRTVRDEPAR